ncbi:hypothetical protein DFH06DRAFT_1484630 [Mycena polygramma]|nr:hypothetical protein DFH06DRAFT_1484630 [Mycena polygramma]
MDVDSTVSADPKPTICPVFEETGECRYGYRCRFQSAHIRPTADGLPELVKDEAKMAYAATTSKLLRTKQYPFPVAAAYLKDVEGFNGSNAKPKPTFNGGGGGAIVISEPEQDQDMDEAPTPAPPKPTVDAIVEKRTGDAVANVDAPESVVRFREKKRLDWEGKTCTFTWRRSRQSGICPSALCLSYGADITCGEMGLAHSFLTGTKEEWSLVRRHPSEKIFGVQLAGSKIRSVVEAAEVLARECGDKGGLDFVDLNCGRPIDLVFKTGSGSALLDNMNRLGKLVLGMNRALGKEGEERERGKKLTILICLARPHCIDALLDVLPIRKLRVPLLPYAPRSGARRGMILCAVFFPSLTPRAVPRVPIFGGGDCFSSQDYWKDVEQSGVEERSLKGLRKSARSMDLAVWVFSGYPSSPSLGTEPSGVDGVMVARGALIKPWIFTEIKERREWDISARGKLEGVRKYAEHFGTDTAGVYATRRYLCDALSFQYRYVPIGLLEHLPGRINDRAPAFRGRNELETLLASGDSRDWVRISEMFLGPAPEAWSFMPKHKSNSYESQG